MYMFVSYLSSLFVPSLISMVWTPLSQPLSRIFPTGEQRVTSRSTQCPLSDIANCTQQAICYQNAVKHIYTKVMCNNNNNKKTRKNAYSYDNTTSSLVIRISSPRARTKHHGIFFCASKMSLLISPRVNARWHYFITVVSSKIICITYTITMNNWMKGLSLEHDRTWFQFHFLLRKCTKQIRKPDQSEHSIFVLNSVIGQFALSRPPVGIK